MFHKNGNFRKSERINVNELDEQIRMLVENKLPKNAKEPWTL
jgi:hypothetical protein